MACGESVFIGKHRRCIQGENRGAPGSSGFPMLSFGQYVHGRSLKTSVIIWPGQNDK